MSPATGLCQGCWRTLDEIAAWSSLSEAGKLQVWRTLRWRKQAALQTPGGANPEAADDGQGGALSDA